jgi:ribosomal protein S5
MKNCHILESLLKEWTMCDGQLTAGNMLSWESALTAAGNPDGRVGLGMADRGSMCAANKTDLFILPFTRTFPEAI